MKNIQRGFTLIELMIVVGIIGILSSIAIPSYRDYIARSQVSEAFILLDGLKAPLTELYTSTGMFGIDPTGVSGVIGIISGKYVQGVCTGNSNGPTVSTCPGSIKTGDFSVVAYFKTIGVSSRLLTTTAGNPSSVHIYYNPNNSSWTCSNGDGTNDDQTAIDGVSNSTPPKTAVANIGLATIPANVLPKACS